MATCPNCGKELPSDFPFCPFCTAPLGATSRPEVREERKVVSVLFCDLVGFTAASEDADPEDVRARLKPYHAQLQQVIESHGGTVEKFVGDAVMAVFGAPVAHEDDAERAVRAGLRILEGIEELNRGDEKLQLQVRVGINTFDPGEAIFVITGPGEDAFIASPDGAGNRPQFHFHWNRTSFVWNNSGDRVYLRHPDGRFATEPFPVP